MNELKAAEHMVQHEYYTISNWYYKACCIPCPPCDELIDIYTIIIVDYEWFSLTILIRHDMEEIYTKSHGHKHPQTQ